MEDDVLKGKTLLVVDDEIDLRDIVASELEFMGARVFQAENIQTAQKIMTQEKIDLIVSDIRMPGGTGIDLLEHVKALDVAIPPVLLITGFADITVEDAYNKGAEALLNKPFRLDDLIRMVVRYTSPYEVRFNEPSFGTLKSIEPQQDIRMGRGGVAVRVETHGKKVDIGEHVNIDFEYNKKRFTGEAICRWFRASDPGGHSAGLGLEFTKLTPESLENFKEFALNAKLIPYIPTFNQK